MCIRDSSSVVVTSPSFALLLACSTGLVTPSISPALLLAGLAALWISTCSALSAPGLIEASCSFSPPDMSTLLPLSIVMSANAPLGLSPAATPSSRKAAGNAADLAPSGGDVRAGISLGDGASPAICDRGEEEGRGLLWWESYNAVSKYTSSDRVSDAKGASLRFFGVLLEAVVGGGCCSATASRPGRCRQALRGMGRERNEWSTVQVTPIRML